MKVAAIIVTHDREPDVVRRALQSVMDQRYPLDDIILIDNGTQRNNDIKNWIDDNNPEIRYQYLPELSGPEARNHGASLTDCEAICFLDDDDEWYPNKIHDQIQLLTDDVCLVTSPFILELPDNGSRESIPEPADRITVMGLNLVGPTSFVMVSKDIFDKVGGFDTSFRSNQEWDLWMRMLEHGRSVVTDDPIGIKHHSDWSITSDSDRRRKGWYSIIRKHMFQYLRYPEQMFIASGIFMDEMQSYGYRVDALFGKVGFYLACVLRRIRK